MLCWRRISAIGTPASPCFRISTIWLSVNRDFRMGISLAPESLRSKCLPKGEAYEGCPVETYRNLGRVSRGLVEIGSAEFFELGKSGFIRSPSGLCHIPHLREDIQFAPWLIFIGLLAAHEPRITGDAYPTCRFS